MHKWQTLSCQEPLRHRIDTPQGVPALEAKALRRRPRAHLDRGRLGMRGGKMSGRAQKPPAMQTSHSNGEHAQAKDDIPPVGEHA